MPTVFWRRSSRWWETTASTSSTCAAPVACFVTGSPGTGTCSSSGRTAWPMLFGYKRPTFWCDAGALLERGYDDVLAGLDR